MRNWIFVKKLIEQPRLWGWKGVTLEWQTRSTVGANEDIGQLLIGVSATPLVFGFATPSCGFGMGVHLDVPWCQEEMQTGFVVDPKGRFMRPGTRIRLGLEIHETEVNKHPFQREVLQRTYHKDGSDGDW